MGAIERHIRNLRSVMTKFIVVTGPSKGIGRAAAHALADDGWSVIAIAPGPTETELLRSNNSEGSEGEARYLRGVPMGRLAQPREIAAAITLIAGEKAAFITGETLFVDGGASLGTL